MDDDVNLTSLENGVITIGDLWDVRSSRRVGFNLFGNKISTKATSNIGEILGHERAQDLSEYKFKHVMNSAESANAFELGAEITCELLGGTIKVTGGLDLAVGWSNGMSTEEIRLLYSLPKSIVMLKDNKPAAYQKYGYDDHVNALLTEDKLKSATHVVTSITIGGRMTSTIKVTQTKKGDNYKFGFAINGEANLYALSGHMGASASVGEDIQITNYECTIDVVSTPPIPAPTSVKDFVPDVVDENGDPVKPPNSSVAEYFTAALSKEKNFDYWEKLLSDTIIGIPITFTLRPLNKIWIPSPDPTDPTDPPPRTKEFEMYVSEVDEVMTRFKNCLSTFRDWTGIDFIKRTVLSKQSRAQKILSSQLHKLTIDIIALEECLMLTSNDKRLEGLKAYVDFKREYYNESGEINKDDALTKFTTVVEDIEAFVETKKKLTEKFVDDISLKILNEIKAVNITEGEVEDPAVEKEEQSPLIYFTHEDDIVSWLKTKRFCKLLYRTTLVEDEGNGEDSVAVKSKYSFKPQTLFNMSHMLGKLNIQPGLAYPTLAEGSISKHQRKIAKNEAIAIHTPSGMLSYSNDDEDMKTVNFVINLFKVLTGEFDEGPSLVHLFTTYCELHGLQLKVSNTIDLIPLVELLLGVFGRYMLLHSWGSIKDEIAKEIEEGEDSLRLLFTMDGVKSSRNVIHALLQLQQSVLTVNDDNMICGSFGLSQDNPNDPNDKNDAPPLFLVWDRQIKAVCLDYLDLLVLLHCLENKKTEIDQSLEFSPKHFESSLCSKVRKLYAEEVYRNLNGLNNSTIIDTPEEPEVTSAKLLLGVVTGVLKQIGNDPMLLVNKFTLYAITILDETYTPGDFTSEWNDGELQYSIGAQDSKSWGELSTKLGEFWKHKEPDFEYYNALADTFGVINTYSLDVPLPEIEEYPNPPTEGTPRKTKADSKANSTIPSKSEQFQKIHDDILLKFPGETHDDFTNEIKDINSLTNIHPIGSARLFASALKKEVGRVENSCVKIQAIYHLKRIVNAIATDGRVPMEIMHEVMHFVILNEIPDGGSNEDKPELPYPEEVIFRMKSNLKQKRYYHLLSDLVENTELNFEYPDLTKFHLEMNRLRSLTDWRNLVRLIQEIAKFKGGQSLKKIWGNLSFQYLIYAHLEPVENQFVLKALAKAFVNKETHSVPKYIPSDIARKLLSLNLDPEGNPIGFNPEWRTRQTLLKSLQVLWVSRNKPSQTLPENFQLYLLQNMELKGDAFNALKEVGALFYLHEDEKNGQYFDEVWDLYTIYYAIIALLSLDSGKKKRNKHQSIPTSGLTKTFSLPKSVLQENQPKTANDVLLTEFFQIRRSPSKDPLTMTYVLYQLKLSKFVDFEAEMHPFSNRRVDSLTQLLSTAAWPLQRELLSILTNKYGIKFAIPLAFRNQPQESISYTSLSNILFEKFIRGLPKIITAIRIGKHTTGKSQYLNCITSKANEGGEYTFASKNSTEEIPEFLAGYTEYFEMSELTTNDVFWKNLHKNNQNASFLLINLHGDALELIDHLKFLQTITSCFLIFWNPQQWENIQEAKILIEKIIKPNHASVSVYIDPLPDTISEVEPNTIIRTPFDDEVNFQNGANAINKALLRRPRQPDRADLNSPSSSSIIFPKRHELSTDLSEFILNVSIETTKSSLVLQKGSNRSNLDDLLTQWNNTGHYSQIILSLVKILNNDDYLSILSDLSEQLSIEINMFTKAWKNLESTSAKEFGHLTLGDTTGNPSGLKKQILQGYFQNDGDVNKLSVIDLLVELCKIYDLDRTFLTDLIQTPAEIMTSLFLRSNIIPVPSIPSECFFAENWSKEFLSLLPDFSVLVVNCIGTDANQISQVTDSLFGASFTSTVKSPEHHWTMAAWSGIYMRFIPFEETIVDEHGVKGVLLFHSKPICQEIGKGHKTLTERDQQIATFLISISNLTLIFDYSNEEDRKPYISTIQTSLISLNRIPNEESTPQIFFVGIKLPQDGAEILNMLQETQKFAEGWVDYKAVSTLGYRVINKAIEDLSADFKNVFNLKETKYPAPLLDAIIDSLSTQKKDCPGLRVVLDHLCPTWEYIRDEVLFPYPDLDEMNKSRKFYEKLYQILNLIDDCFNNHVEDFPMLIFEEMSNIINSWAKGELGEISIATKKDILWTDLSSYVINIFDECDLPSKQSDTGDNAACEFCKYRTVKEEEILADWEDSIEFTKLKMYEIIGTYIKWEVFHNIGMAKQIMAAYEETILQEEKNRDGYDEQKENIPDLTPVQRMSLERRVVPSKRRLQQDVVSYFPGIEMGWTEHEDNFQFLTKIPAFSDGKFLTKDEAAFLEYFLKSVPGHKTKQGGEVGIYQMGMVRRTVDEIEEIFEKFKTEMNILTDVVQSFKFRVISHNLWLLEKKLIKTEGYWIDVFDPLKIFMKIS